MHIEATPNGVEEMELLFETLTAFIVVVIAVSAAVVIARFLRFCVHKAIG